MSTGPLAVVGGLIGGVITVIYLWEREWRRALASQRPQY